VFYSIVTFFLPCLVDLLTAKWMSEDEKDWRLRCCANNCGSSNAGRKEGHTSSAGRMKPISDAFWSNMPIASIGVDLIRGLGRIPRKVSKLFLQRVQSTGVTRWEASSMITIVRLPEM